MPWMRVMKPLKKTESLAKLERVMKPLKKTESLAKLEIVEIYMGIYVVDNEGISCI